MIRHMEGKPYVFYCYWITNVFKLLPLLNSDECWKKLKQIVLLIWFFLCWDYAIWNIKYNLSCVTATSVATHAPWMFWCWPPGRWAPAFLVATGSFILYMYKSAYFFKKCICTVRNIATTTSTSDCVGNLASVSCVADIVRSFLVNSFPSYLALPMELLVHFK